MARRSKLHSWDLTTAEARDLQLRLAAAVDARRPLPRYTTVAGADVSYDLRGKWLHAAVVVLRAETFEVIDRSGVVAEAKFPYVPGLLSFREAPAVIEAFEQLKVRPDILMCDGQGIAHPRRMGLASHLGLSLEIPTIGCAKSWLCGDYEMPGLTRGEWTPLTDGGETIGAVLRTRTGVKPLFISPGHLCDLASAIAVVLATAPQYRVPITTRLAHQYVNELRRQGVPE
ncbi:MAG TPA: deoxyribonuclease V [Isosphaeraceae bacterium]|nr:deoxyribonuclease V [Isosphaeraceae bacterium]